MTTFIKGGLRTSLRGAGLALIGLSGTMAMGQGVPRGASPNVSCSPPGKAPGDGIMVGESWSGVRTQVGAAASDDGKIYVAYYDPERYITVASYDRRANQVCRRRLPSRFGGWDAHNAMAVAISADGVIHITGNMHASPLIYGRGTSLDSIKLTSMTGMNETHVTYPRFLVDAKGNLLFQYRDGRSGDGIWRMNRWVGGRWIALPPLFADVDGDRATSAYPSDFLQDANGRYHVAVVWRRTSDVSSNYKVTYASTLDFRTWRANGKSITGPLAPDDMESVDSPGEGAGLVNNVALHVSSAGQPAILFTKYAPDGTNAVYLADRTTGWRKRILAKSTGRTVLAGGGSIPDLPAGSFVEDGAQGLIAKASFGRTDQQSIRLAPDWLSSAAALAPGDSKSAGRTLRPAAIAIPKDLADSSQGAQDVRKNGVTGPSYGQFRWFGQKSNRDHARLCDNAAPKACNPPPSPLILYLK